MESLFQEGKRKKKKKNVQRFLGIDACSKAVRELQLQPHPSASSGSSSSESEDVTGGTEEEEDVEVVADQAWRPVETEYKMSCAERGKAIIFNQKTFTDKTLQVRGGTEIDQKVLVTTLRRLGFAVKVYNDLRRRCLLRTLENLSKEDHTNRDCLLIAVLSHGTKDEIHARDEAYKREELWEPFMADKCPSLANKPKIFIIQACRGSKSDKGTIVNENMQTDAAGFKASGGESFLIPNQSDFMFLYSSFQGYTSFRRLRHGSPFIATLCRVLKEHGEKEDLLSLSTVVNYRMSTDFQCTSPKEHLKDHKQCPAVESSLTRKIYFRAKTNGGIYADRMEEIRPRVDL